nr:MAG TPA: hypothetical protein [Microviridae sp.]
MHNRNYTDNLKRENKKQKKQLQIKMNNFKT